MSEALEDAVAPAPTDQQDWRTALPEDLRANPNFTKYSSLESFAKGHLNAVSMLGKTPELKVPENEDERADFFNKLGRPASPDKYELKDYEYPEEHKQYVTERVKDFKTTAHKLGLTAEQAANLYDWYMSEDTAQSQKIAESRQQQQAQGEQSLRKEWGEKYDHNVKVAQHALSEFGGKELVEYLNATGLGNNPALIRAFQKAGEAIMGDEALVNGDVSAPAEIQGQIKEIMARKEYWDSNSLERPALVEKVQKLMQRLHPDS
jgi:hypothetical protein